MLPIMSKNVPMQTFKCTFSFAQVNLSAALRLAPEERQIVDEANEIIRQQRNEYVAAWRKIAVWSLSAWIFIGTVMLLLSSFLSRSIGWLWLGIGICVLLFAAFTDEGREYIEEQAAKKFPLLLSDE